jgi:hypothetical protein
VLVLGRLVGAGRLGDGDLDVPVAWAWTLRAGRIVAAQAFERNARPERRSPHGPAGAEGRYRSRAIECDLCASSPTG